MLKQHHVIFRGNPTVPEEWKRNVAKGPDIFLELGVLSNVDIECKFTNHKIQPSYVLRDYLPRFDDTPSEHRKIILTNDLSKFGNEPRRILEENGIELWDSVKLIRHLLLWTFLLNFIKSLYNILYKYNILLLPSGDNKSKSLIISPGEVDQRSISEKEKAILHLELMNFKLRDRGNHVPFTLNHEQRGELQ